MIISQQKQLKNILEALTGLDKVFIVGCGECATTCKSGGEAEVKKMKADLESSGKTVTGYCIPSAPCVAPQIKSELAKNMPLLRQSQAILVLACGLGVQSVKENDRLCLTVTPGCDTLFGAVMDAAGNFREKCSMCGECVLDSTAGVCPITLCPKGLLNGPCGGMNKGKCETDKDKDCAWVLIYKEMEKKNRLSDLKKIKEPKDFKKANKPRNFIMTDNTTQATK